MPHSLGWSALLVGAATAAIAACRDTSANGAEARSSAIASVPSEHETSEFTERLRRALFVHKVFDGAEHGERELDPLLWPSSTYLLTSPRYEELDALLVELDTRNLIPRDLLRRAMLERYRWALFDWLAKTAWPVVITSNPADPTPEKRVPRSRHLVHGVANAMRRIALTQGEIAALPDNYAAAVASHTWPTAALDAASNEPFLPPDLLNPTGEFVPLRSMVPETLTPEHDDHFRNRSLFSVHLRLPGGRAETLAYLLQLRGFPDRLIADIGPDGMTERRAIQWPFQSGLHLNPNTPQFPVGTEVALVRRMAVFDNEGRVLVSHVVESVELRRFRRIDRRASVGELFDAPAGDQQFIQFVLDREQLFDGVSGGLRAVRKDELRYETFRTPDFDVPDLPLSSRPGPILDNCIQCHGAPGLFSMPTYTGVVLERGSHFKNSVSALPNYLDAEAPGYETDNKTELAKSRRFEWGVLQELLSSTR
jgi:hypothetical protein